MHSCTKRENAAHTSSTADDALLRSKWLSTTLQSTKMTELHPQHGWGAYIKESNMSLHRWWRTELEWSWGRWGGGCLLCTDARAGGQRWTGSRYTHITYRLQNLLSWPTSQALFHHPLPLYCSPFCTTSEMPNGWQNGLSAHWNPACFFQLACACKCTLPCAHNLPAKVTTE